MIHKVILIFFIVILSYISLSADNLAANGCKIDMIRSGNDPIYDILTIRAIYETDKVIWITIHKENLPSETTYYTILSMLLSAKANGNNVAFYSPDLRETAAPDVNESFIGDNTNVTWIDVQ